MRRLNEKHESLLKEKDKGVGQAKIRRDLAIEFEKETEDLIVEHQVTGAVAEYVRHVVREGYDVAFDLMDPTSEALLARNEQTDRKETPG
jgi:hypothetical protein